MISTDTKGIIEFWDLETHKQPKDVTYKYKSDTDLYDLAKSKTQALSLDISPDGQLLGCVCADQQIRIWKSVPSSLDAGHACVYCIFMPPRCCCCVYCVWHVGFVCFCML